MPLLATGQINSITSSQLNTLLNNTYNIKDKFDTNDTDILTNTTNIATNTTNIATNTTNIATNTTNIATNASNIATNTTNISTINANISTLQNKTTDITYSSTNTTIANNLTVNKNVYSTSTQLNNVLTMSNTFNYINADDGSIGTNVGNFTLTGPNTLLKYVNITIPRHIYNSSLSVNPSSALSWGTSQIVIKDSLGNIYYTSTYKSDGLAIDTYWAIGEGALPVYSITEMNETTTALYGGKTYYIWAYTTINTTSGSCGVFYNYFTSGTITYYDYKPDISTLSGYLLTDNVISNNIFCNNLAGVFVYIGANYLYPVMYSNPDLSNYNINLTSTITDSDRQDTNLALNTGTGSVVYSGYSMIDQSNYLIYPKYGIVLWAQTNYTGNILINYKNKSNNVVTVKNVNGNKRSIKIYYMDKEITKI